MQFTDDRPIYSQIVDYAYYSISSGAWVPDRLIPSVRELAASLGVNTRTVMKAIEMLQTENLVTPKRGMGFILVQDAPQTVREIRRRDFFSKTLPAFEQEMRNAGVTIDEVINLLSDSQRGLN